MELTRQETDLLKKALLPKSVRAEATVQELTLDLDQVETRLAGLVNPLITNDFLTRELEPLQGDEALSLWRDRLLPNLAKDPDAIYLDDYKDYWACTIQLLQFVNQEGKALREFLYVTVYH